MGLVLYTGVCGVLSLLAQIILHFTITKPSGAAAEMALKNGPFRDLSSPLMLYFFLCAPTVQALATYTLASSFFGANTVAGWSDEEAVRFTVSLWAATSAHGILLDYTTFRISPRILVHFWVGSLTTAAIIGVAMARCL